MVIRVNSADCERTMMPCAKRFLEVCLATVFPPKCMACGSFDGMHPVDREHGLAPPHMGGSCFCPSCSSDIVSIESPLCAICGTPFVSREGGDHACSGCLIEKRDFDMARSFGIYRGSLMEAIHRFKYEKKFALSRPLSALIRKTFFQFWDPTTVDLLVPVPLHIRRLRKRGFNQAYLLAAGWAKREGLSVDGRLLRRERQTKPQTNLDRRDRQKNISGAFSVTRPACVENKRVLVIDDVYTTGATAGECAHVLKQAGAARVDVLTLARAV